MTSNALQSLFPSITFASYGSAAEATDVMSAATTDPWPSSSMTSLSSRVKS
jgi:hypothetical protein